MPTNVVMPQMGESIAEGTIVRWIKKVGDDVDRDEPLFEISTDKVDAEIPSPGGRAPHRDQGQGRRDRSGQQRRGGDRRAGEAGAEAPAGRCSPSRRRPPSATAEPERGVAGAGSGRSGRRGRRRPMTDDAHRQKSSPLVRRIAQEHNVDITQIQGTGISGRVTKQDILDFIESGGRRRRQPRQRRERAGAAPACAGPVYRPGENVQVVPMSVMRRKIAEHMVLSAHTSPHVYSVYEVNFGRVSALRETEEGGVRGGRREAHLHRVHRQGHRRRAPRSSRSSTPPSTATTSSTRRTSTSASPSRSRTA